MCVSVCGKVIGGIVITLQYPHHGDKTGGVHNRNVLAWQSIYIDITQRRAINNLTGPFHTL